MAATRTRMPDHLNGAYSPHTWRRRKRWELRLAIDALELYRSGAAYTPTPHVVLEVLQTLRELERRLRPNDWPTPRSEQEIGS